MCARGYDVTGDAHHTMLAHGLVRTQSRRRQKMMTHSDKQLWSNRAPLEAGSSTWHQVAQQLPAYTDTLAVAHTALTMIFSVRTEAYRHVAALLPGRLVTEPSGTLSKRGARKAIDPIRYTLDGGGPIDNGASSGSGCKACRSPVLKACLRIPLRWMPAAAASTMII